MPRPSAGTRTNPIVEDSQAVEHLRAADPVMGDLLEAYEAPDGVLQRRGRRPTDAYGALLRAIVGQQLSTKAARTIYERLTGLFEGRTPTPAEIVAADPDHLRSAGLSRAKVAYLRDLAERVEDGDLDLDRISELPDEDVIEQMTAVKGLGAWTVHMFLIFHLGRPDVLPVGDLGIRNAALKAYGLRKLPQPARLERLARPWRPHRSLASLYLWRSLDNEPA